MKYSNVREEELKNKIARDYFWLYDCSKIIGNVDFCVSFHQTKNQLFEHESLLWAEAKQGTSDIYKSITQLILTIGKARTFDRNLPPAMLGAFDCEKIAFIPYSEIHDVFYMNDFNWNVTPSNHDTKEFQFVENKVKNIIDEKALLFDFEKDDKELIKFIKSNFVVGKFGLTKIRIDKNNFMVIYNKWLQTVKPTIAVNWEIAKKSGIIDGDFYLADLLSYENESLKEKLFVLLKKDHYELDRKFDEMGMFSSRTTTFNDGQKQHNQFWNKYERPPREEYWDYIVERRDLLVPQDVRERKGSFFTPQIWVELSQKYIADVLGENWQDEYYVWDCAAGTGNLLAGLINKYNVWASTLDMQDVEVMKDRIKNGTNLLEDHVFQFDFLNDDFEKLPKPLFDIINNPEKRKKLVMYINPPYAEAGNKDSRQNKAGVKETAVSKKYYNELRKASNEIFIQFLWQIYTKFKGCKIAEFSKIKHLTGLDSFTFRQNFLVKLEKGFLVPAYTFDNVKGSFPIGFKIWNTDSEHKFSSFSFDVYDEKGNKLSNKNILDYNGLKRINDWLRFFYSNTNKNVIGVMHHGRNDFQSVRGVHISSFDNKDHTSKVTPLNLLVQSIYFTIHNCIEATWLNDRDQFLYPNDGWKADTEFQNDCLAFALFQSQNRITSKEGINHWIPFTEQEVNSREKFESNFMCDFIRGKYNYDSSELGIFSSPLTDVSTPSQVQLGKENIVVFSTEAQAVFDAGKELWKYYHAQPKCNVNASLYDIREHFQGRNEKGKMNNKSNDERYMELISILREKLKLLAKKIEPKVYEYGFLK
ncbi:MAG TPA: hypothetical protein PK762_07030 [Candidatus Kapabacteria bacterium]|nr:hypothetical protein [Candidatus Kapabacteria bacterium]